MGAILVLASLGFLLLLTEMFLPGGVLGVLGGLLLVAAVIFGYVHLGPLHGTILLAILAVLSLVGFCAWMTIFPKTVVGRGLILGRSLPAADPSSSGSLAGREGTALTPLRPAGKAMIDGRRLDVTAESEFVAAGETVVVRLSDGVRVVVGKKS